MESLKEQETIEDKSELDKREYDYVFDFEWTEEMQEKAKLIINEDKDTLDEQDIEDTRKCQKNWEKFYKYNKTNFFKDRHYILKEFPELRDDPREEISLLDIGCGVGNSFYPLLEKKTNLKVNAFDFSNRAVAMAKTHTLYNENRTNLMQLDIAEDLIPDNFKNADYSILMFVLSAITPDKHESVIKKIYESMKIGGILYFRDYALYDLAQLRFAQRKKNKVGDNLYARKDKTLAYYFNKIDIENLFKANGFEIVDTKCICRLIENRKENKRMHRLWLQIKLKKI